ncbi:MAG: response regulator [Candidatus Scalindua sp.]|nr:response regulator [Candidatus Scalindua sp.]
MNFRILLVDDEETLRSVLQETLAGEGYSVDVANDGFQALERFKITSYDLLITDVRMQGMDGLQLIREIKKNGLPVNVIMITAYGSGEAIKEAMRLGVVELFNKPFKLQEIKDAITRILNRILHEKGKNSISSRAENREELSIADSLLVPAGLSYYVGVPGNQQWNTAVFDFVARNSKKALAIFGNIHSRAERPGEWWDNRQITIMIQTLFRSNMKSTPRKIVSVINDFLSRNIFPHVEVSILCLLVDVKKSEIRYVHYGSNLVCSVFSPGGKIEILESCPVLLGVSPGVEICESSMTYGDENQLMLLGCNSITSVAERESLLRQAVDVVLLSTRYNQRIQLNKEAFRSRIANKKEADFDDETYVLMNLDWDDTVSFAQN